MCGIAGVYDRADHDNRSRVDAMLEVLAHRGPDGSGKFAESPVVLGNRRLAILDLSAAGAQPMQDRTGRYVITYNGEIFNYSELRIELEKRGHRFSSESDTEVLLTCFAEWGEDCLDRLNGMFAFGVYDRRSRTLFCARDRLGVKPLVYTWDATRFAFASEHKALLAGGFADGSASSDGLYEYLIRGHTTDGRSLYAGVRSLQPGCALRASLTGELSVRRWWSPPTEADDETTLAEWGERVRELVEDSVRIRLRSDVTVGAHLSGGLDSSAVVGAAASQANPLATFTGAMRGNSTSDERAFAREVNAKWGLAGHEVELGIEDLAGSFDRILWHLDEPVAGPAVLPHLAVCDLARSHGVKVALGGQGGDELFGGYRRHQLAYHGQIALTGSPRERARATRKLAALGGREWRRWRHIARGIKDRDLAPSFVKSVDPGFRRDLRRAPRFGRSAADLMRWDLENYLPSLLHVEDRTSMAASLESRTPLLDYRLVELASGIPSHHHFDGPPKAVLHTAVRAWLPDAVAARRDKRGFPTPLHLWKRHPPLRELMTELTSVRDDRMPVFEESYMRRSSSLPANAVWRVMMVQGWLRQLPTGTARRAGV